MMKRKLFTLTGTSPASASTAIITGASELGLSRFSNFTIDAIITGGTGGTIDLILQRRIDASVDIWLDWAHFTQVAAATTKRYTLSASTSYGNVASVEVGATTTAAAGTAVLAAGSIVNCHPGDQLRLVAVAGAGTSAGAVQTIYLSCFEQYT